MSVTVKNIKSLSNKQKLVQRDGLVCVSCMLELEIENLTTDHIVPKSMNGSTDLSNQRLLCLKCHKAKNMLESKVKRLLGRMIFSADIEAREELFEIADKIISQATISNIIHT